jgi:hypothetical protein
LKDGGTAKLSSGRESFTDCPEEGVMVRVAVLEEFGRRGQSAVMMAVMVEGLLAVDG